MARISKKVSNACFLAGSKVKRVFLFDKIPVDSFKKDQLPKILQEFAYAKKRRKIFYLNAQAVEVALSSSSYLKILQKADLVTVDGWAPVLIARFQKKITPCKISIGDYLPDFFKKAGKKGFSFYLLGSRQAVIKKAVKNLQKNYPKLKILGWHHGYFNKVQEKEIIQEINKLLPDFLLVGLGLPKQEKWIEKNFKKLKATVFLSIGGTFDFLSGKIPRAPLWMRNNGLEWVFRLIIEPRRLWRRYLLGFFKLGFKTLKWKFQRKWQLQKGP